MLAMTENTSLPFVNALCFVYRNNFLENDRKPAIGNFLSMQINRNVSIHVRL